MPAVSEGEFVTWALMRGGSPVVEAPAAKMVGMSSGVQLLFAIQHLRDAASACLACTLPTAFSRSYFLMKENAVAALRW